MSVPGWPVFLRPLDAARSWFRYHQMFAGLLRLELRRTEPGQVTGLHAAAAGWFAAHGFAVQAVRPRWAGRAQIIAARPHASMPRARARSTAISRSWTSILR